MWHFFLVYTWCHFFLCHFFLCHCFLCPFFLVPFFPVPFFPLPFFPVPFFQTTVLIYPLVLLWRLHRCMVLCPLQTIRRDHNQEGIGTAKVQLTTIGNSNILKFIQMLNRVVRVTPELSQRFTVYVLTFSFPIFPSQNRGSALYSEQQFTTEIVQCAAYSVCLSVCL